MENRDKVIIIGGGAAGLMAAACLDMNKYEAVLLEKNEKLGKKLYITGKGRCNLTNACDMEGLLDNIVTGKKFMYSSIYSFNNFDAIDFFEANGLKTKIERGNRVFPQSDHSSDVIRALEKPVRRHGVEVRLNSAVKKIIIENGIFSGVVLEDNSFIQGAGCIIATGGLSYPSTGSTGDGYEFAKNAGHTVTELYPSLVSLKVKEKYPGELMGLSLKNVRVSLKRGEKILYEDLGEMLFTQDGVSGPLILTAGSVLGASACGRGDIKLCIDCKPALSVEQLDARILRDFEASSNKQFKNSLNNLLPRKLIAVIIELGGINPDKKVNLITKEERRSLADLIKCFTMTVCGTGDFNEAVVTRGGVEVSGINPKTMESKLCRNLFFVGEVLDVDALTGGFNLQVAWSTAHAAAMCLNKRK